MMLHIIMQRTRQVLLLDVYYWHVMVCALQLIFSSPHRDELLR